MKYFPELTFKKSRRKNQPEWIFEKVETFNKNWHRKGEDIMSSVSRVANIDWPKSLLESGLSIFVSNKRRDDPNGLVYPDQPRDIYLYVKKSYGFSMIKDTLIHELLHSLMWETRRDLRRRPPSLFEDFFADEIIVSLAEKIATSHQPISRRDCEEALEYGIKEAHERLSLRSLKRRKEEYQGLLDYLKKFSIGYGERIKGDSDILRECEFLSQRIPSPFTFKNKEEG